MNVTEALRRRRMTRSFDGRELDPSTVTSIFDDALRAPTAGNSRGVHWTILIGNDEVYRYFEATTDASWRERSARAAGLMRASAVGICTVDPQAYVERYSAPDKANSGLGQGSGAWPVPFWIGDAGASMMAALLRCEESGLAATFLGSFRGEDALRTALGLPNGHLIFGAILLGHPDGHDHRSASLDRPGLTRAERLHFGGFSQEPNSKSVE